MKSQEEEIIDLDQFRLQLNQLQQLEKELQVEEKEGEESFVYKIEELPMSISNLTSWFYFSIHLMWPTHLLLCYVACFSKSYTLDNILVNIYGLFVDFPQVGFFINGSLVVVVIISILFPRTRKDSGVLFILDYIGSQTYPYLRYLIEISLYLSAFFATSANPIALVLFSITAAVSLIQTLILQNFTLRKGQFCCKSIQFSLTWRIALLLSLTIGIIGVNSVSKGQNLIVWAVAQTVLGTILLICYYSFGIYIYRHKVPRFYFFFLINAFLAFALAAFFDSIQAKRKQTFNYILEAPIFLVILTFFNWSTLERRRRISACPENSNLKQKIYFLFNKFEHVDLDDEDDCQIRGILHYHFVGGCSNARCMVNLEEVYDSKKKKNCSIHKIGQSRVSLIKFYIKCLYERALEEQPQNIELRLDFVQFYYLKLKNIFNVLHEIAILQTKLLSPFQRLRLNRLKKVIHRQCNSFSEELYLHNLSTQKTLQAESIFDNIQKKMEIVIQRYQLFWKYIQRNEVFLSDMFDTIRPNFDLVDQLNQDWAKIADYFSINRRWKFYFLCFSVFVKNQKLKPTAIEDFGNSVQYDIIFKTGNHFIDKTTQKQALYNPIMLFEQNTCFISVSCDQEKMLIKKVSNYFNRNFDHESRQVINYSLDCLLPPSIREFHHAMFLRWVKEGKTNNEEFYSVKEVMPLTSKGYLAPCFKFYKYYLRSEGQVQYIAMLKRNKKDEMFILANEHFQIEAITQSLAQKLKIDQGDYFAFRGLNLLSLIPMLVKYTRLAKYIGQKDEVFYSHDDNQAYFKKQSSAMAKFSQTESDILGMKKLINLTNLKMSVPLQMQEMLHHYKNIKKDNKYASEFQLIKASYEYLRKTKRYLKFKGEMYIREKSFPQFSSKKYYQFQINELEENNRLQKLKMDEFEEEKAKSVCSSRQIEANSINEVDMQLFLQLNKKKNKVMLFPSKNIFLKDENNQALTQISHISNISLSFRFIVAVFIVILSVVLIVEVVNGGQFSFINQQYYQIATNQKMLFLLNSQYNVQHIQPGNHQEQAFFIVSYTNKLLSTMTQPSFQQLLFNQELNPPNLLPPYYPDPYPLPILSGISSPPLDQISIFRRLRQCAITLNHLTQLSSTNTLEVAEFHILNNYLNSYYTQSQKIKTNIANKYNSMSQMLQNVVLILGITEVVLIVLCLLFSLSRLLKVTNGFSQLLSIFIQMDNSDIKKILKYMEYVFLLFNHLKVKYERMGQNSEMMSNSVNTDLDKFSNDNTKNDELITSNTNANLNKKLKKIELGSQIKSIQCKTVGLTVGFLVLVSVVLFTQVIYSRVSLDQLNSIQNIGFTIMDKDSLSNQIVAGVAQKFRNATTYNYTQYQTVMNDLSTFTKSSIPLQIAAQNNQLSFLYKSVNFQNFCTKHRDIMNRTLNAQIDTICSKGQLNSSLCQYIRSTLTDTYYVGRCEVIQNMQLPKGAISFKNYLINRYSLFFQGANPITTQDVMELNQGFIILGIYEQELMSVWLALTTKMIEDKLIFMVIVTCMALVLIFVFHLIFVEYFISNTLNNNYEMFRRMHQNLIPDFVINKEKIIKAKLIKQGFMKE